MLPVGRIGTNELTSTAQEAAENTAIEFVHLSSKHFRSTMRNHVL